MTKAHLEKLLNFKLFDIGETIKKAEDNEYSKELFNTQLKDLEYMYNEFYKYNEDKKNRRV